MIHGIFYNSSKHRTPSSILDGTHPILNIDPLRQRMVTWSNEQCWLAQSIDKSDDTMVTIETQSPVKIVAWARMDHPQEQNKPSDAQLILRAYLQYGTDCTQHLHGDFCFAIYDLRTNQLLCVRSPMGAKPFYYYSDEHVFVFCKRLINPIF